MKLEIPRSFTIQCILHRHRTIHSGPLSFSLITVHDLTVFVLGHVGSFAKIILRKISQWWFCRLDPGKSFTSIWSCTTQVDSGVKLAIVCRCSSVRFRQVLALPSVSNGWSVIYWQAANKIAFQ